jgi:hypothetical protein
VSEEDLLAEIGRLKADIERLMRVSSTPARVSNGNYVITPFTKELRVTRAQLTEAIESATYSFELTEHDLDALCQAYAAITGDQVSAGRRKLLARVGKAHGPDAAALISDLYAESGKTNNLLYLALTHPQRTVEAARRPMVARPDAAPTTSDPIDDLGLLQWVVDASPNRSASIECADYLAHRSQHHRVHGAWVCDECQGTSAA